MMVVKRDNLISLSSKGVLSILKGDGIPPEVFNFSKRNVFSQLLFHVMEVNDRAEINVSYQPNNIYEQV